MKKEIILQNKDILIWNRLHVYQNESEAQVKAGIREEIGLKGSWKRKKKPYRKAVERNDKFHAKIIFLFEARKHFYNITTMMMLNLFMYPDC